jgi:hypothetical protein
VLDVLIAYHRAELDGYQRRIERADTRAAGVITIAFALAGLSATSFAALGHALGALQLVALVLGGCCILGGVLLAFISRDSRFRRQYLGLRVARRFARWSTVPLPMAAAIAVGPMQALLEGLENAEDKLSKPTDLDWPEGAVDAVAIREVIAQALHERVRASFTVALWTETASRRSALFLCGGLFLVAGGFALTVVAG